MTRRRILEMHLASNRNESDLELESFMRALFATDDDGTYITYNVQSTVSLAKQLPIF